MSFLFPASPLAAYVAGLLSFVQKYVADEDATDTFVRSGMNLIGDLASSFKGSATQDQFKTEAVLNTIQMARTRGHTKNTLTAVKYARAVSCAGDLKAVKLRLLTAIFSS